jgi:PKD repeat protein
MRKKIKLLLCVVSIVIFCGIFIVLSGYDQIDLSQNNNLSIIEQNGQKIIQMKIPAKSVTNNMQGSMFNIFINATMPEIPRFVYLYNGILSEEDINHQIKFESPDRENFKTSIPSKAEAPALSEEALGQYGGLPVDAVFDGAYFSEAYEQKTGGEITTRYPIYTAVFYSREILGMPIVGRSDMISVDLGENGELLYYKKIWRSLENVGKNVSVIPVQKAIEKLQRGETINQYQFSNDLVIYSIRLGYYEKDGSLEETFPTEAILEPVWVFYGNIPRSQSEIELYIYARQFASFTATPTYGKSPLTVTFTDTSDASPIKWNWDFGDGTTSIEKNPVHTYTTAGAYTITLTAWNDLGSDTMTKTSQILLGKKAIVTQAGSKLDELIAMINAMNLDKGIKNSLVQKLGNAKAKNTDALKFVDQTKETQANNMLNAEDNQMNAFMNDVKAQTGKAISTADAATLNSGATEIRGLIQAAIATPI